MKKENPFTLMFGKSPKARISRDSLENDIIEGFSADQPIFQTYLISGVRGAGKTVLVTNVAERLKATDDWIVVDLNVNQELLTEFANRLEGACKMIPNFFEKGFDISVLGIGVGIGGVSTSKDSTSIIEKLLTRAKKRNKKVLILIDEVVNSKNMKVFASQFQIFAKSYPVFLIMTGLYDSIYSIQNNPALTFLLRSPKVILEPLSVMQITRSYQQLLSINEDTALEFAKFTKGYAFAFQAFGMLYYEYGSSEPFENILTRFDNIMDDYVYQKIWESLSEVEKNIMRGIPTNEPIKTCDLCDKIGMKGSFFSQYRIRLLRKGVLKESGFGVVENALPRFGNIIKYYN